MSLSPTLSLSSTFLNEIAYQYHLSPDQRKVFILRFAEEKDYEEIAQLLETSPGACLKRMGQVYSKFKITGDRRGKESSLQNFLLQEYKKWSVEEIKSKGYIIYTGQNIEHHLAYELKKLLMDANHEIALFHNNIHKPKEWSQVIKKFIEYDYLVLLLSEQSAVSELLIEQLREIKELQQSSPECKPIILSIYLNLADNYAINHDLKMCLQDTRRFDWLSPNDTPELIKEIITFLQESQNSNLINTQKYSQNIVNYNLEKSDGQPLPVAYPELPEGQVDLSSNFYIERPPIESLCKEIILQPGALISIKAPRQMGKTSLMARVIKHGEEHNYKIVNLTLQLAERNIFSSLGTFLRWFCTNVSYRLLPKNKHQEINQQLDNYWNEYLGFKVSCTGYFEEYLLPEIEQPIILAIDELDIIFEYEEIASEFLGLLRTWHELSKNQDIWKKLRLIICYSTEVYINLNVNQSPFNVGLPINLPRFTFEQVKLLASKYGLILENEQIQKLMQLVGGHPYLIRLGLYHIARKNISLEELIATATKENSIYSDHLRRQLWIVSKYPELFKALKDIVNSPQPVSLNSIGRIESFKLASMGLVQYQNNSIFVNNNLYQQYFTDTLTTGE